MQSTRQRVLNYVSQHGSATARQLASAFSMTPANLRHHLTILATRGLLISTHPSADGRGRPENRYSLSASAQPNNLSGLTTALLRQTGGQNSKMRDLAKQMLRVNGSTFETESPISTKRLVAAVKQLTPMGYQPRWEARPNRPEVVLGKCPYAAIIAEHPELCQMDAFMLEELLGTPVEQLAKLQRGPQGTLQCIFQSTT